METTEPASGSESTDTVSANGSTPGEVIDVKLEVGESPNCEGTDLPESPDEMELDLDNIVPTKGYHMAPMVALGGSAGSIRALQNFFTSMPVESGMIFVVILHLSPEHESSLAPLLGRTTTMPVMQARDGIKVEKNHVYVIPPGKLLSVTDGHLRLTELEPERGRRVAVDLFFRTLADTHGPHSAAIVLSGADGDGAIGIKRIKERGGLTIAQDPDEAEYDSMPRAAISTGMVDWVLQVTDVPGRLKAYFQQERRLKLPPEEVPQQEQPSSTLEEGETALRDILTYLRTRTGRDFSYYKRATILRRISRRMQVNAVDDLPAYLAFLRTHAGEASALLNDMLISVTNFFRDRGAFSALEKTIPELFAGKKSTETVRVWVPACATGEEAYSIAMLLVEHARMLDKPPTLQIFATDLDESVIQAAREGLFPNAITADVSEERLDRFFIKEHSGYRVRRELREIVLFALHDLLKDSPFSRIDLVSCRNLLIYLNRDAQARAFDIFHFSLKAGGRLFLGSSESVESENDLFLMTDKKHRLYVQRPVPRVGVPVPSGPGTLVRALEINERSRERYVVPPAAPVEGVPVLPLSRMGREPSADRGASWGELHFQLIERFAPPSLVVNAEYEIVHLSETAGRFLQFSGGEPSRNLLRVVHPMLRLDLRATLFTVSQTKTMAAANHVLMETEEGRKRVTIRVMPAGEVATDFLLVVFEAEDLPEDGASQIVSAPDGVSRQLEKELETLKTQLRDTVEQSEASGEELKASNEELQAMNEELRSATEELETGREELQSINEELITVNQELKGKVDQLAGSNSDLQNLMSATAIATIFLDRDLRIMRYTPSAVELFNLIPSDLGRPLTDLKRRLDYPEMEMDAAQALDHLRPTQREVRASGRWFFARALPYRTNDDRIAGVVFTFLDITERKQATDALASSQERLRLIIENASEYAIFSLDLQRKVTTWNPGAERLLGYKEQEIIGEMADVIFTPEDRAEDACQQEAELAMIEGRAMDERWHLRKDGTRFWGSGAMMAMRGPEGVVIGFVKIFRDQTQARKVSNALEESQHNLLKALEEMKQAHAEAEAASQAKDHFLAVLSHELRTPLTPVLMAVQMMLRRKDLPPMVKEVLEMISRNVKLEAHFIDDLLDVTRARHGKMELALEPMDVHQAIREAVEVVQGDLAEKKQELTVALAAASSQVQGDFSRLQQVFWNLLKNSAKFTPDGGAIRVASRDLENQIIVEVSDTGIGLEPEQLAKIFDPFTQADANITKKFGGLGLGLAIANVTVAGHGGELRASSAGLGQGTTFSVILPVLPVPNDAAGNP